MRRLWTWLCRWVVQLWLTLTGKTCRARKRVALAAPPHRIFAQPKPQWVKTEVIRLKALMPQAGCRTIAHLFNRRWAARRAMTVSKTYLADTCRGQ